MTKQDPNKTYSFQFDEQGTNEVSEQIMNSYNSGVIDQDTYAEIESEGFKGTEK
jgi:hypothetical protein